MKKLIGFDIDGVLADFVHPFGKLAEEMFGIRARSAGAQQQWRFNSLTDEQERELWDRIDGDPLGLFWENLPLLVTPGELADMDALRSEGYMFIFVTSRHSKAKYATERWLGDRGFVGGLHMMKHKAPYLAELENLRAFIDDSPAHLNAMHETGVNAYARDWPYNREIAGTVPRVGSVGEYLYQVAG